jgi:hypothetical protein
VTAVAKKYGFRELGRLAGSYGSAFSDSPSDTLRRARPFIAELTQRTFLALAKTA